MDITIRFAQSSDIKQLKHIWRVCFGDEDAYIDSFLSACFQPENTVVAVADRGVVGVIYMLSATLEKRRFMYGYAIGVLPEYRGNNICEKMHQFVSCDAAEKGYLYGLHPANEKLYEYYRCTGLRDMFSLKVYNKNKVTADPCIIKLEELEIDEYYQSREHLFSPLMSWNKFMLSYIVDETKKYGGFAKKISINGNHKFLIGTVQKNTVIVKETTLSDEEILYISDSIMEYFDADKIIYYLPMSSSLGNAEVMILGFGENDPEIYMNLFID